MESFKMFIIKKNIITRTTFIQFIATNLIFFPGVNGRISEFVYQASKSQCLHQVEFYNIPNAFAGITSFKKE